MDTRESRDPHDAGALYERLAAEAARRKKRRGAGRAAGIVGSIALIVAALAWAGSGLSALRGGPGVGPTHDASNYRFTDRSVSERLEALVGHSDVTFHWLVVTATPEWTSEDYPGWHDCTWRLVDAKGKILGETSSAFSSTTPGTPVTFAVGRGLSTTPGLGSVDARVSCDAERLDSPERLARLAAAGEPNYEARDVAFSDVLGDADLPAVSITYAVRWTGDTYPGEHDCAWLARDANDAIVAMVMGQLASMMPNGHIHPIVVPLFGAEPTSAEVLCDPTRVDTPVAYEISRERVTNSLEIEYDMVWPQDIHLPAYPGENACGSGVLTSDGRILLGQGFTLSAPPGTYRTDLPRDALDGGSTVVRAMVRCIPYENDGSIEDARQLLRSLLMD